jgi:putative Ca2+/H+ antiporter (TMEM165/GDT1 family)
MLTLVAGWAFRADHLLGPFFVTMGNAKGSSSLARTTERCAAGATFPAELADLTQFPTISLAARFHDRVAVGIGVTAAS